MSKVFSRFAVVVMAMLLAVAAFADAFDREVASIILLQMKPVQQEIGVTPAQRAAMNKFATAHREKLAVYYKEVQRQHQTGEKNSVSESKLVGMFEQLKNGVLGQLRDPQIKRLRELSLQALDFTALADKAVADRVGIDGSHQERIRTILNSGITEASKVRDGAIRRVTADLQKQHPKTDAEKQKLFQEAEQRGAAARQQVDPQLRQIRARTKQQVMAQLTAQQKARWQALLGKPFHFPG